MDHHCPWIANCVGFKNHKYFFLLVLYSLLDCVFVIATVSESVQRSLVQETQFTHRFLLVFCTTLAVLMGSLLMLFLVFHTWLMLRTTTTMEFCEKTYRPSGGSHRGSNTSIYDRGFLPNVRAVLGPSALLWFLPVSLPEGDGLSYAVAKGMDEDECGDDETSALLPKMRSSAAVAGNYHAVPKTAGVRGALTSAPGDAAPEVTPGEASIC